MNKMKTLTLQGVTFEVVDEQARADIDVLKENSGSGGASSWNDLTDKPFGETTVMGDTLTWDGNTEGLEYVKAFKGYKVSDAVLTEENLLNASFLIIDENGEHEPTGEITISKPFEGAIMFGGLTGIDNEMLIIVINDVIAEQLAASAGTYFTFGYGDTYVSSLTIPGYNGFETTTIQPLDEKYLPESVKGGGGGGAQPDWNANDGESGHVLNRTHYAEKVVSTFVDEILKGLDEDTGAFHYKKPFSVYAGEEYTVSWDGIEYKCICIEVPMEETTLLMLGNVGAVLGGESTGEPFLIFTDRSEQGKQGISEGDTARIAPLDGSTNPHVKITGLTDTIHELAPRYIATEISAIKAYIDTKAELAAERANIDISEGEYKQGTLSRFFCEHIERGDRVKLVVGIDGKDYYFLPQFYNVDGDNIYRANIIFNTTNVLNSVGHLCCLTVHINMYSNDDSSDAYYILEKLHGFTAHELS